VWGARVSLLIGVLSGIGAVGLGTLLGIAAGYLGGFWDEALGRITDFVLVLPFLPLLIIITFILSQSPFLVKTVYTWIVLIFTILSWPTIAKIVRSQVLTVKERSYVEASRAVGAGTSHVLRKHILPNVTGLVYSQVALNVSGFILLEAALDFLTVSLYSPNVISWGLMLTYSLPDATSNSNSSYVWWWFLPPGIAIAALSLAFVLVGFALDQVFNPRLRAR
jgi:peptide/nickel transport system permease protein